MGVGTGIESRGRHIRSRLILPIGSLLAGGALGSVYDDGQAANAIASYSYIGGRTLKRAMQNGINLDMRNGSGGDYYDALGRPTRWAHVNAGAAGALVVGWERSYDRGGNAIAQRSLHDAKDSQRYTYDAAARLTAFSLGDFATGSLDPGSAAYCDAPTAGTWGDLARAQEWHLDGLGNWRTFVQKSGTAGAQPVSEARVDNPFNQYASIGGAAQAYDANGNLLVGNVGPAGEARQLKWDAFNRLREVRTVSGGGGEGTLIASYVYDAGNRRMRKAVAAGSGVPGAGTSTDYYYTGWQIGETRNPAVSPSAPLRQFVFGNYIDEPLVMDVNAQQSGTGSATCIGAGDARYFYHANPIFSVGAITNASGQVVEAYEYDAYGKHVLITDGDDGDSVVNFGTNDVRTAMGVSAAGVGNLFAFTGREYDGESGMQNNRDRMYAFSYFISRDPIGMGKDSNLYRYTSSSPIIHMDPMGQDLIAVGTRNIKGPIGYMNDCNHMSLEYWEGCMPSTEVDRPGNVWKKAELEKKTKNSAKDYIQLQREVIFGRYELHWPYQRREWVMIPTSRIEDKSEAKKFNVRGIGQSGTLLSIWRELKRKGHSYEYALDTGEEAIPPSKWPKVKYFLPTHSPGNNSNTFIRWLIGEPYDFPPGGDHAGAMQPIPPPPDSRIPTRDRPF